MLEAIILLAEIVLFSRDLTPNPSDFILICVVDIILAANLILESVSFNTGQRKHRFQ